MKEWITVAEVARYLKLSDMMIYKLAQAGEIPAAKIGNRWRFDRDEIDDYVSSQKGNRRQSSITIPAPIRDVVDRFQQKLKKTFGERLAHLLIFGSWARGDQREGSDIDCLVVLRKIEHHPLDDQRANKVAYEAGFEQEPVFVITCVVMSLEEFEKGSHPLLINIRKEGLKAA